jgi:hypothetical protein
LIASSLNLITPAAGWLSQRSRDANNSVTPHLTQAKPVLLAGANQAKMTALVTK